MDNNTVADTGIDRVITCGVRWGATANSYADLMTNNGVCVLATNHGSKNLFRSIGEGDLIALKDGRNIIALGKPLIIDNSITARLNNTTWKGFFNNTLNLNLSAEQLDEKEKEFGFSVYEEIDLIFIEEWLILDTPIYYPLVQGTVTIRDEYVKQECINAFNGNRISPEEYIVREVSSNLNKAQLLFSEYMVIPNTDIRKINMLDELLGSIDIVLNYEPDNEIVKKMKISITKKDQQIEEKSKELAETYKKKANLLLASNVVYIIAFIATLSVFIGFSTDHIKTFEITSIPKDILIVFIVTKGFIASSMILSVFWVARFLNRRIHENVYLIEEYKYKALMFDSLQNLKDVFGEKNADEVFKNVIEKIIENPAINLVKIKDKKSDITLKNIKEIAETVNEVKKNISELPK